MSVAAVEARHLSKSFGRREVLHDISTLVNPDTLVTVVRYVNPENDFHKLTRFLVLKMNPDILVRIELLF